MLIGSRWPFLVSQMGLSAILAITGWKLERYLRRQDQTEEALREVIDGYRTMARETSALVAHCLAQDEEPLWEGDEPDHDIEAASVDLPRLVDHVELAIREAEILAQPLTICLCQIHSAPEKGADAWHNALTTMENLLMTQAPTEEHLGRGEKGEFLLLLPVTTALQAGICLERVRQRWQTMVFGLDTGIPVTLDASFAVVKWEPGLTADGLLKRGAQALTEARQAGGHLTVTK